MKVGEHTIHFFRTTANLPLSGKRVTRIECTVHLGACARSERPCGTEGAGVGVADCSPKDVEWSVTGRKIAMRRALEALGYTKEVREAIWRAFHAKYGVPKPRKPRGVNPVLGYARSGMQGAWARS